MKNLGSDGNLDVVLSTYKPNILCGRAGSFTQAPSCGGLLENMPASTERMLFGPDNVPGIQEPLPQLIASCKPKLGIRWGLEFCLMDV